MTGMNELGEAIYRRDLAEKDIEIAKLNQRIYELEKQVTALKNDRLTHELPTSGSGIR